MPCSSFPPQPNSPTQCFCYTMLLTYPLKMPVRGPSPTPPVPPRKARAEPGSPACVPKVLIRGLDRVVASREKARMWPIPSATPVKEPQPEGPSVRYSISKAMSKVAVFQGRCRDTSRLCYTFRITSHLCLESSSTGSSFPANCAKPVPLAVVSLDSR